MAILEFPQPLEGFPTTAFYQHHNSLDQLEQAAAHGCRFCNLVKTALQGSEARELDSLRNTICWTGLGCDPARSMWAVAKSLDNKAVRICADVSHIYDPIQEFKQGCVFDILWVQIGTVTTDEDSFPPLRFTIKRPQTSSFRCGDFRIGRAKLNPDLASQDNFIIARQWLSDCLCQHIACPDEPCALLPTRVIDVGTDSDDLELCRVVYGNGRSAQYITLSHCWGGTISVLLKHETLQAFQCRLPFDLLPSNFRDAITVARRMGIRYIWIDSLCIIQDSKADWEAESRKMAAIYLNSTITLAASAARNSREGFLKVHQGYLPPPVLLPVNSSTHFGQGEVEIEVFDHKEENLQALDSSGPLSSRAWTLQESIMPLRMLFYGERQLYWRCPTGFQSAEDLPSGRGFPEFMYPAVSSALHRYDRGNHDESGSTASEAIFEDYYRIVEEYSGRQLSFDSDKLPAFSGLAMSLQKYVQGQYIAGIWTNDLLRGLRWKKEMRECPHVSPYRAPSWSWAVTNASVVYHSQSASKSQSDAVLKDYRARYRDPANTFGEVLFAELVLGALIVPFARSIPSRHVKHCPDQDLGFIDFDEAFTPDVSVSHVIFLIGGTDAQGLGETQVVASPADFDTWASDSGWELDKNFLSSVKYYIMILNANEPDITAGNEKAFSTGLALRTVMNTNDNDTFERVGLVEFGDQLLHYPGIWTRRLVKLV